MKAYKLTDENGQTYNRTQWGPGVTHTASGEGPLCSGGWIHVYSDPLLAVLLNPIHGNFQNPRLWECEVAGITLNDAGLKQGWVSVTTLTEMPLPSFTVEQIIAFGILCAKEVVTDKGWNEWADNWLTGKDRSKKAEAAASAAAGAAWAAWEAGAAAWAWEAAARATRGATRATRGATRAAARATRAAARATRGATRAAAMATRAAARAAEWATRAAARSNKPLDLIPIARNAMKIRIDKRSGGGGERGGRSVKHTATKDEHLWVYSMGKRFRVRAICTTDAESNDYMGKHASTALIAVYGPFQVIANCYEGLRDEDKG